MGTITSSIGLVSGINTGQIIDELMSLESQPVQLIQTRIDSANNQMQAYNDLETQLSSLHSLGLSLELPTNFKNSTATSTDPSVLTATTTVGGAHAGVLPVSSRPTGQLAAKRQQRIHQHRRSPQGGDTHVRSGRRQSGGANESG